MATELTDEEVKTWRGRIALAKRYQERFGNTDDRWTKYVKGLAGDFNSEADLGPEAIDVNITRSDVKTRLAPLWLQEPYVTFTPTIDRVEVDGESLDNIRRAEFSEVEINYWLKELRTRTRVTKPCVLDAETTNHGYAYLGYISEKEEVEQDGERTEANPWVRFKQPFIVRKSPREVLLQPGCPTLEDCEWIVLLFDLPLRDAREKYKVPELKPSKTLLDNFKADAAGDLNEYLESEDAQIVEIQVVWDKRKERIVTFAEAHETALRTEDWTLEMEGFPLVDLSFEDIPDEYYGTPPQQYAYPQQKELNAAQTKMRKRFNRSKRTTFVSGDVSDDMANAYEKSEDGTIIRTGLSGDDDIRKHLVHDEVMPQDNSTLLYAATIQDNYRQITGTSAEQRGSGDPNVTSATSSANIQMNTQIRSTDRGDRVKVFYEQIARKLWMILKQQPDVKRDRRVAGPLAGGFKRLRYSLDELRGEFAVDLNISTVLPDDPQTRQTVSLLNYKLLAPDPLANRETLILDVLRSQNKTNLTSYLTALRTPQEEFAMMLELLPVEPHERDDHERHLKEHELQQAQIEAQMEGLPLGSQPMRRLQFALALVIAHANSQAKLLAQIAGAQGRQQGSAPGDNQTRSLMKSAAGAETPAEMGGQALIGATGGLL